MGAIRAPGGGRQREKFSTGAVFYFAAHTALRWSTARGGATRDSVACGCRVSPCPSPGGARASSHSGCAPSSLAGAAGTHVCPPGRRAEAQERCHQVRGDPAHPLPVPVAGHRQVQAPGRQVAARRQGARTPSCPALCGHPSRHSTRVCTPLLLAASGRAPPSQCSGRTTRPPGHRAKAST